MMDEEREELLARHTEQLRAEIDAVPSAEQVLVHVSVYSRPKDLAARAALEEADVQRMAETFGKNRSADDKRFLADAIRLVRERGAAAA